MLVKQLTKETIDQVVFGMENQDDEFYLDLETMEVSPSEDIYDFEASTSDSRPRYVEVPSWQSVDGFNLMERFVGQLHNPLVRVELQQILASGRGVFRQFKDVLRQYPEVSKRWYRYKEQSMQRIVVEWFVSTMETYGIQYDNPDFEETEDLVLDDFSILLGTVEEISLTEPHQELEGLLARWDQEMVSEIYPDIEYCELQVSRRNRIAPSGGLKDFCGLVSAPDGSGVGFLRISLEPNGRGTVTQLYVVPEYRGLGIARTLIDRVLEGWPGMKAGLEWWIPSTAGFVLDLLRERGYETSHSLMSLR